MEGRDKQPEFNWVKAARRSEAAKEEINTKMDPELSEMLTKLSKKLFEMKDPEMAKKLIIEVFYPGIERWERLQAAANGDFGIALNYMQTEEFDKAVGEFRKAKDIRDEIGEKEDASLAMAFVHESLSRMWFKNSLFPFSNATEQAKKALELFKELGNQEGIVRIEKLIQEIEEQEDLARDLVERTIGP